jgi:hypothetical protein
MLKLMQSKWDSGLIIPMYIINLPMDISIHGYIYNENYY